MAPSILLPSDASSIRPRNRRLISVDSASPPPSRPLSREPSSIRGTSRLASGSATPLRDASPLPSERLGVARPDPTSGSNSRGGKPAGFGSGLLAGSWMGTWGSVQDIAAGWLSGGRPQAGLENTRTNPCADTRDAPAQSRERSRPSIRDVGAGVMAEREAALKAARMASVLESHEGVNGGLDVAGKFKLRTSDDLSRQPAGAEAEDALAYIHHVKPTDTYAGIVLKYGCQEQALKKANGLWTRDIVSTRKWLAVPVDACDVKGRPCAAPSDAGERVDLLAPTPNAEEHKEGEDDYGWRGNSSTSQQDADDIFRPRDVENGLDGAHGEQMPEEDEEENPDQPWTHVRWVALDAFKEPVEIGRISRKAMGYFPPRRKKRYLDAFGSTLSTPRESLDVASTITESADAITSDRGVPSSSRRPSVLSNRPAVPGSAAVTLTPTSVRSRVGSVGADPRPAWMRRPGGVGPLSQNVRRPGPDKDPLNSWAKKHFPSLVVDSLPSMSFVGAETARFGFSQDASGNIAEGALDGGQKDVSALGRQGTGLDRAAAAVETWLRGAFTKRDGVLPVNGPWGSRADGGDLIELADTQSEDGRFSGDAARAVAGPAPEGNRLGPPPSMLGDRGRGCEDMVTERINGRGRKGLVTVASSASLSGKGKNKDD